MRDNCRAAVSATYNREAPRLGLQIGRYARAKQYKRMRKVLRTLRSRVGRVIPHGDFLRGVRDVERQVAKVADSGRAALLDLIDRTKRVLAQKPKGKNKLHALHTPEVECLAKGKARKPYEFGVKVSITTTHTHYGPMSSEQAAILCDATPTLRQPFESNGGGRLYDHQCDAGDTRNELFRSDDLVAARR